MDRQAGVMLGFLRVVDSLSILDSYEGENKSRYVISWRRARPIHR